VDLASATPHLAGKSSDVDHGRVVDNLLKARTQIQDLGQPITSSVPCGHPCPSCGKNATLSKARTVLATFGERPPLADFVAVVSNMGGSDAHSIVAQSVIRKETRATLDQFLTSSPSKSPCVFKDEDNWQRFKEEWTARLMSAASQPADEMAERQWLAKKKEKFGKWEDDTKNREILLLWLKEWEEEAVRKPSVDTGVKIVPEKPAAEGGTQEQKKAAGRFFDLEAKEYLASSRTFDSEGNMIVRKVLPGESAATKVVYERIVDKEGHRTKDTKTTMLEDRVLQEDNLLKAEGKVLDHPWVGNIFSKIMGKPFTEGTQCRYCEEIQADGSLVQRMQIHERGGCPDEYVGRHLLRLERTRYNPPDSGAVIRCDSAQEFLFRWLDDVSFTLRERILEECERESARSSKKADKEVAVIEPSFEAKAAVREAVAAQKGKEFKMTAIMGAAAKKVPPDDAYRACLAVLMNDDEFERKPDSKYKPPKVDASVIPTAEEIESQQRKQIMQGTLFKKKGGST